MTRLVILPGQGQLGQKQLLVQQHWCTAIIVDWLIPSGKLWQMASALGLHPFKQLYSIFSSHALLFSFKQNIGKVKVKMFYLLFEVPWACCIRESIEANGVLFSLSCHPLFLCSLMSLRPRSSEIGFLFNINKDSQIKTIVCCVPISEHMVPNHIIKGTQRTD